MSSFLNDYKRELTNAAGSLFAPALTPHPKRPRRTLQILLLGAALVVFASGAALAAGIFGTGAPVPVATHSERPAADTGVGIPVEGIDDVRGNGSLLSISVPDPAGGLPWGMRIVDTTRGLRCVQIGRLRAGQLGIIGQDGEFHDNHLFHELPAAATNPDMCTQPGREVS